MRGRLIRAVENKQVVLHVVALDRVTLLRITRTLALKLQHLPLLLSAVSTDFESSTYNFGRQQLARRT